MPPLTGFVFCHSVSRLLGTNYPAKQLMCSPLSRFANGRYDFGQFYASKTFYDPVKKRQILWGWV